MSGLGECFHALGQSDGVTLRGIIHAQVVSDLADHHFTRVEPDPHAEGDAVLDPHLVRVLAYRVANMQRGVTSALGVILVRDRRTEECHDSVTGELIDRAFEAVHALGENLEEALEDAVPLLGIELLGEFERPLHVREQDRHVLALAFEHRLRLQDLVGEVLGRVGTRVAGLAGDGRHLLAHWVRTLRAEAGLRGDLNVAFATARRQRRGALHAETSAGRASASTRGADRGRALGVVLILHESPHLLRSFHDPTWGGIAPLKANLTGCLLSDIAENGA